MQLSEHIKDHWTEQRIFTIRVIIAGLIGTLLILFLMSRLVVLQVLGHDYFADLSQGNQVRIEPIPPTRGLIYDRHGVLLAENVPTYQLEFTPERVLELEPMLTRLLALGLMDEVDLERVRAQLKTKRRFDSIPLRYRLNQDQVATFAVRRHQFPGVDIKARLARHYPLGGSSVHAIGYVGSITESDLERLDPANYANTTHVGRIGVERARESILHGQVGYRTAVVNAQGRWLNEIDGEGESPHPGWDLHLNIDANLQAVAEQALAEYRGALVAIDPRNGEVLTFVSTPNYDPNPFGEGLSSEQFRALQTDPNRPMFNRAVLGRYPPGSTIKPILALAALADGTVSHSHTSFCPGFFRLPGREHRYRDWKPEGHGWVNYDDAIAQSCDVFFYELAVEMGIDEMHAALTGFGLGSETGIEIIGEKSGLVPSRAWKRSAFSRREDQVWFPGETVITGIGQGFTLVTPMQLAHATATLAARGKRFQPQLIRGQQNRETGEYFPTQPIQLSTPFNAAPEQWEVIVKSMENVVHGPKGSARAVAPKEYRMAGKSGTAQVFTVGQEEEYDAEALEERLRDHALFVAFAPVEEPTIAVAVVLENAGSGSGIAAPVAKSVVDAHLLGTSP